MKGTSARDGSDATYNEEALVGAVFLISTGLATELLADAVTGVLFVTAFLLSAVVIWSALWLVRDR